MVGEGDADILRESLIDLSEQKRQLLMAELIDEDKDVVSNKEEVIREPNDIAPDEFEERNSRRRNL